jgi:hypothetical protein
MASLNIIRPPKIKVDGKGKNFWSQIGMIIIGTTISLVLTIVAAQLLERHQRAKDRRLSALMVMANIENFANNRLDGLKKLEKSDSICTWLLSVPVDELELLPENELGSLMNRALFNYEIVYDRAAESIFSSTLETWKNMGNFQFINNVEVCFDYMRSITEEWNRWAEEDEALENMIRKNPDQYPGKYKCSKVLRNPAMRESMELKHNKICYMRYNATYLLYMNKKNMEVIGISQEELYKFIEESRREIVIDAAKPIADDYYTPYLSPDSITTVSTYKAHLDSIKAAMNIR